MNQEKAASVNKDWRQWIFLSVFRRKKENRIEGIDEVVVVPANVVNVKTDGDSGETQVFLQ